MFFASEANWGSSAQAAVFVNALKGIQNLTDTQEHVKNYRPKVNTTNVLSIFKCQAGLYLTSLERASCVRSSLERALEICVCYDVDTRGKRMVMLNSWLARRAFFLDDKKQSPIKWDVNPLVSHL